jgi:hypothetical protein
VTRLSARRRPLLVLAIAAAAVIAGLIVAGLQTIPVRTYSLRQPDVGPVASLRPGHSACEGPVTSTVAARGVGIFGRAVSGRPTVEVRARSASRTLATGELAVDRSGESVVPLNRPIPAGRAVHVCVSATGGVFSLVGDGSQVRGLTARGVSPGTQFSLVLTRPATFLGSLQTAFSRAAVFKPSWVGAWTFWLLLALLGCTVVVAGVAVARAAEDDEADESSHARDGSP